MDKINVSVFIDRENKNAELELEKNSIVADLLKNLNINPVTVIVSRNNDEIKILSVISGG